MNEARTPLEPLVGHGELRQVGGGASERALTATWLDGRIVFDSRRWICRKAEMRWVAPAHLVVLTQHGGTKRTRVHTRGSALCDGPDRPGVVSFVPAGEQRQASYEDADLVYAALWFDPGLSCLDGVLKSPPPAAINAQDGLLAALLNDLLRQLAEGLTPDACYVEHLLPLAFYRTATLGRAAMRAPPSGKLGATTLRRIEDYIDAHLRTNLGVSALAGVAGIGVDSFARRFKASTGMAPYAFVLERRMRRAEHALAHSRLPIANLAVQLGFASQSHFTATFRRRCGMTPQAYRAAFFRNDDSAPEIVTEIR